MKNTIFLVVHHNFPEPQTDAGSAIFLHIWRHNNLGTAGCTAMSREHLNLLLSWLEKDKNPVLIQLPISEYNRLHTTWNLPAASP
ncbi:MAG: hypothetical protein HYZ48_00760 [Chlamydiales bacterium]|nr:hypothetical protein [Chlamydiales bacterium]